MAHYKKAFPSKYLQAADLDTPIMATIKSVTSENVGSGDQPELKLVAAFREDVKGVVLNLTRAEAIAELAGDEDTDTWPGTRIRLSRGTTHYRGKRVACIAVDAPPKVKTRQKPVGSIADDINEAMPSLDEAPF